MTWFQKYSKDLLIHLESKARHIYLSAQGCCSIEIENLGSSSYDLERLGFRFVDSPEEASLMMVSGWINQDYAEKIKEDYAKLILDKAVIAVGACAISGSPYLSDDKILLSDIVPVNAYLPGCPPRPEALIDALIRLERKQNQDLKNKDRWIYEVMKSHG